MKNKFSKIRVRTLCYLIAFALCIVLLLWGVTGFFSTVLYEKYQIRDIEKIAKEIRRKDVKDLDRYLTDVVYDNEVCIEYISKKGVTLYNDASTGCMLGRRNDVLRKYKTEIIESGKTRKGIKIVNPEFKTSALIYGVKIDTGYVFLFTMLSNINKNNEIIRVRLFYITILIIILAVVLGSYLAKMYTEPIVKISTKAKELAKGNFDVNFEKAGIVEVDELVDSLNYMKTEVSKTDQYRRDLIANVSHDLKTPLTMIKAYAEMVRDITYDDKEKREANLNVIIDEADRLNVLVGDILSYTKMQANRDTLVMEKFDLKVELDNILKKYDYLVESEGYKFDLIAPEEMIVLADKNKLNQVIYNLLNNAINYTGKDKLVTIRITENKDNYLVEIIDTGKGIDKKEIDHIWDKYYKSDKKYKRNVYGTGLGLSIVKEILMKHNFKYGVESTKGKGSNFYFYVDKYVVKK